MTEDQVRIIVRDEMYRLMAPKGTRELEEENPKPVTCESRFIEIVMAASTRNWTQIVESCETQKLTDDLIASTGRLTYEQHKKFEYCFQALNAADMSRFGLKAPCDLSTVGVLIKEQAVILAEAKATRDAEATEAAKLTPMTQNGMTRNEVFAEENERKTLYGDANLRPLERNLWAYQR